MNRNDLMTRSLWCVVLLSCGGPLPSTNPDGGGGEPTLDAGSATPDAGSGTPDAGTGTPDAGTGTPDAGTGTPDAGTGTPDAGTATDGGTPALRSLGVATQLTTPCQIAGNDRANSCIAVEVTQCPDLPDPAVVELRITNPTTTPRGVVIFGSGGGGAGFYDSGRVLAPKLAAAGFTVIERAWRGGWTSSNGQGFVVAACKYATVLHWLKQTMAASVPLCASGNSGGAAELGYTLGFYGSAPWLKLVVPTGGPVATRWDHYCNGAADSAWQQACDDQLPQDYCVGRSLVCSNVAGTGGGCGNKTSQQLFDDSVMAPAAVKDYGTTDAHFMQGLEDCGQPNVPIGLLWHASVTSHKTLQFLPNTPHEVVTTTEGQDAFVQVLTTRCVP